jgi:hypothetical protein
MNPQSNQANGLGAHFLVVIQLTNREIVSWALFSTKFLIERAPSIMPIFEFWDYSRIMAIKTYGA